MASVLQEYVEGAASVRQASGLSNFGDKPLVVLTADTGHDEVWRSAQDRLAALSTNAVHRLAEDTTHTSMLDDRADSAAASQAIRDVVAAVRSGQHLTR